MKKYSEFSFGVDIRLCVIHTTPIPSSLALSNIVFSIHVTF